MSKNIKKFSLAAVSEAITFDVDTDTFTALPANRLPAGFIAQYFADINDGKLFEAHLSFFKAVLTEDSWKLFDERLSSTSSPITVALMGDVATWLLGEQYMGGGEGNSEESKGS